MSNHSQDLIAKKLALEKQVAELSAQIEASRTEEQAAVLSKIKAMMDEHGVTLAELGGKGGKRAARGSKKTVAGDPSRKVAPKYRNTVTGDTWSGRGLQPKWLKAAIGSGRKIEDFAV